ncbi:MAG: site-specific DNA-methyltransferase [Labilithrix sp.]|nr:site-specific DNA-methyltransferase [Labilithrix sp.]
MTKARTKPTLEELLATLARDPASAGRRFSKADLHPLLSGALGAAADDAFARIRAAAKATSPIGSTYVSSEGERRKTRYVFATKPKGTTPRPATGRAVTSQVRTSTPPTRPEVSGKIEVFEGDNLPILASFDAGSFDLIYVDPPFNTGKAQSRTRIRTDRDEQGDRVGFQGRRYRTTVLGSSSFADRFDDYLQFLAPRLEEAHRLLKPSGSFFLHLDYREVHYAKVMLDEIFGRASFINEIIWSYDYGARATNRWSPKHDTILWYAKHPDDYCFNFEEIDRIPYMAPSLVGEEKAARGKTPTDSWWHTIVSPNGKEKTGYPTQKPLGVLTRIVRVHSRPGDRLLDFFAGSGSFGEAGAQWARDVVLVDENPEAIEVMRRRFSAYDASFHDGTSSAPGAGEHADGRSSRPRVSYPSRAPR